VLLHTKVVPKIIAASSSEQLKNSLPIRKNTLKRKERMGEKFFWILKNIRIFAHSKMIRGNSSVGRARPCQGRGREFESRFPLKTSEKRFFYSCMFKITAMLLEVPGWWNW
jgi:hypothetical protein